MKSPLSSKFDLAAEQSTEAPRGAPCSGTAAGLVTFKTSGTPEANTIEIDQVQTRLKRLRRSVTVAARLFSHVLGNRNFKPAMLTLTYRDVDGFCPRDVSELLKRIRNWLSRRGHVLRYVWVAELQVRGALHYHVLLWLPRGLTLPKPDKQGWWPHGHTRIEWARNAIGYLCKYVSKFDGQAKLPKGCRLHGSGGHDDFAKSIRQWFNLPSWLKALAGVGERFVRIKGVGLVERGTGVCLPSPWRVSYRGGRVFATQIFEYANGLANVCGPYSRLEFVRGQAC
ncbi:rolling circle replication-associated protein [Roseateles albus]|uniref:Replication-associated protein ORF2/G2P domain-containing protein n=1 Tax=Roseateles albus TaxID=2987525 RepID=A0ABT5K891_9BURK|nr:hypothetical protein [Roseateles albus]MDC8769990.1 hypothetical protein [Roseateles albus]